MLTNDKALEIARSWIGTPYRHQCSLKGEGTDCLGLLRGVYRELYSTGDPKEMPNYSMSWNEHLSTDPLIEATREFLDEVPIKDAIPGDVLVFRMRSNMPAKHCGILSHDDKIIHAYSREKTAELYMTEWWWKKVASVFRFREIV